MRRAIGKPRRDEQEYQDAARAAGCMACLLRRNKQQCGPTEIHHRNTGDLAGQKQLGQSDVVALGAYHHRGIPLPGYSLDQMRDEFGPSLHHHKRDFLNWLQDTLGERSTAALQRWQDQRIARPEAA